VNGAESCGSDFLLNKVLKGDWKYPGWVLSDWGAVDDVSYFMNGLDQQSGAQLDKERWFGEPLKAEIAAGRVPAARVSDAVRRILRSLYAVGADTLSPPTKIDYPANAKVSLAAAQQGIVLLKNDGVLPLAATARSILVVGGQAEFGVLSGGGSSQVTPANGPPRILPLGMEGQMNAFARELYMPSSPLAALKAALPQATIGFDPGYSVSATAAAAAKADLVIVFATKWEGEGFDSPDLSLPRGQDDLIAALADANRNVVVVLETGNPVTMPWLADVRAVVEA
jgi:beta-glucosidase